MDGGRKGDGVVGESPSQAWGRVGGIEAGVVLPLPVLVENMTEGSAFVVEQGCRPVLTRGTTGGRPVPGFT